MGRLIREKKFATEVEAKGRYCALRVPIDFRRWRRASCRKRAPPSACIRWRRSADDELSAATALKNGCSRFPRSASNISATWEFVIFEVWVHAMETPNDRLYYFRPDELLTLKLATAAGDTTPGVVKRSFEAVAQSRDRFIARQPVPRNEAAKVVKLMAQVHTVQAPLMT